MKVYLAIFFFFCHVNLFSNPSQLTKESDYIFQPYTEEGYFQGWNYSFLNSEYQIFVTALVSNLGPNSLNNGISLSIESKKTGSFFVTKEFGQKDLKADLSRYYLKLYNNEFEKVGNNFIIKIYTDEVNLFFKYENIFEGVNLSRDKKFIYKNFFVKADVPFSYSKVTGYIEWKKEIISLTGVGGMEHLLTNYEVYKFSRRWEMLRSISNDGTRLFLGGYHGKEENDFYRRISIQDKTKKILLDETVSRSNFELIKKEPFSGYFLPYREKIFISEDESCSFTVEYLTNAGRINVLENISQLLRFFVRLFFANPYIVNFHVKVTSDCPSIFAQPKEWTGIKSDYLINPK